MPPKRLGRLGRLSSGESLIIDRHRRKETQGEAAWRLGGITAFTYGKWERDLEEAQACIVGRLKPHEKCLVYRRRADMSQSEVALGLGRSRYWITQMERGVVACDELLSYWEK